MNTILDQAQRLGGKHLTTLVQKARAYATSMTEIQLKVLDATNNEPWGPHGKDMSEISNYCLDNQKFHEILDVIEQRLLETPENWRLVYKTLLLLEFLVKQGPMKCVEYVKRNTTHLERLADDFHYKDPNGKDQGINVRQRAKELMNLVSSPERIKQEREKAQKNAGKYIGVSSTGAARSFSGGLSGNYNGTSSNSYGGSGSIGGSGSGGDAYGRETAGNDEEDPFEATRRRIERLKAEGAVATMPEAQTAVGSGDGSGEAGRKGPKKLSDVKVNPAIVAAFSKPGFMPAPPQAAPKAVGGASADFLSFGGAAPATSSAKAADAFDLLAGLDVPTPAPAPSSQATSSDWDAFGSLSSGRAPAAPPAPAAADADWSGFASSQPVQKPSVDIGALLNIGSPSKVGKGGPLLEDDFAAPRPAIPGPARMAPPLGVAAFQAPVTGAPPPRPVGPNMLGDAFDPFGDPFSPPAGSTTPWGFGAPASGPPAVPVPGTFGAPAAGVRIDLSRPKLGPATEAAAARAKDPFADLKVL